LRLHVALSRAEGTDWKGHKGRINAEFLSKIIPDIAKHPVYLCGPMVMMTPTIQLLRDLGVPMEHIKLEEFISAKNTKPGDATAVVTAVSDPDDSSLLPDDAAEPTLTFKQSEKSVALAPDKSLLELAEEAGVNIDFECRSGICGRCKTRLLAGSVTMEVQDALDAEDKSKNIILMCQAKATRPVTVEA
jgi:ferredoxin